MPRINTKKCRKKLPKQPGVYCVKVGSAGCRCMRRYYNGKARIMPGGDIRCPSACRRK